MWFKAFLLFFLDYDTEFLRIDIDLSTKYKQDISLQHETESTMATPIRKCVSIFCPSFSVFKKS